MGHTIESLLSMLEAGLKGITTQTTLGSSILEPEQFDKFVRAMQKKTVVLPRARLQVMDSRKVDIDRIAFVDRVLGVPPTEGTAKSTADFVAPSFGQHQLESEYMQGVIGITDQTLRNNPERAGLMDTIMEMAGERAGIDVEELGIKGDSGSSDPFLALNDGWLKLTRRRVVEATNAAYDDGSTASFSTGVGVTTATVYYDNVPITGGTFQIYTTSTSGTLVADEDGDGIIDEQATSGISGTIDYESGKVVLAGLTASTDYYVKYTAKSFDKTATEYPENGFSLLLEAIPKEYFTKPDEWMIACPWPVFYGYIERLRARGTALGDEYQTNPAAGGMMAVPYGGVPVVYVPNMPLHQAWLTQPDNTIYGVFHEITAETEREAKAKRTDLILDAETDYQFEEPEASVVMDIV